MHTECLQDFSYTIPQVLEDGVTRAGSTVVKTVFRIKLFMTLQFFFCVGNVFFIIMISLKRYLVPDS